MPTVKAPTGLKGSALKTWRTITSTYALRQDELVVLEDACREMMIVARLEEAFLSAPLVVDGSMGQPVVSPLAAELRQHRSVQARLLAQLKLPDSGGSAAGSRSAQARDAANALWGKGKQRGA